MKIAMLENKKKFIQKLIYRTCLKEMAKQYTHTFYYIKSKL